MAAKQVCIAFMLSVGLSSAAAMTTTTTPLPTTTDNMPCQYNGKYYYPGQSFQPTPCEHCYCSLSGRPMCAVADCMMPMCADAVHDPTKCCATCPNGENCRAHDGTIIKKGDTYHPDPDTSCECPVGHFGFGFGSNNVAICAVKIVEPFPVTHVDPLHVDQATKSP